MLMYLNADSYYFVQTMPSDKPGFDTFLAWTEARNGRPSIEEMVIAKAEGFDTCYLSSMAKYGKRGRPFEILDMLSL